MHTQTQMVSKRFLSQHAHDFVPIRLTKERILHRSMVLRTAAQIIPSLINTGAQCTPMASVLTISYTNIVQVNLEKMGSPGEVQGVVVYCLCSKHYAKKHYPPANHHASHL